MTEKTDNKNRISEKWGQPERHIQREGKKSNTDTERYRSRYNNTPNTVSMWLNVNRFCGECERCERENKYI